MPSLIWFGMIIPFILVIVFLIFPNLRRTAKWWEFIIPIGVSAIVVCICQYVAITSAVSDKEYWGFIGNRIVHEEPFAYDSECPESYPCGQSCDSKGNCTTIYCTRWVHCVEHSSRKCFLIDNRQHNIYISYDKYKELANRWNNYKYYTSKIVTESCGYRTVGDKYNRSGYGNQHQVTWDKNWETSEPIVVEKIYENRVQTLSHWGNVSEKQKKQYDVFEYPMIAYGYESVSTLTNGPTFPKSDKYLRYLNGVLNTDEYGFKRVRLWVLIWNEQPQEAGELQRKYWKNGNKNEFIVFIGTNKNKNITWCDVLTWSESDSLTISVRDHVSISMKKGTDGYSGKLTDDDLLKFYQWLGKEVQKKYVKPSFKKYEKINVQPSMNSMLISIGIILAINIGVGIFIVKNPWSD